VDLVLDAKRATLRPLRSLAIRDAERIQHEVHDVPRLRRTAQFAHGRDRAAPQLAARFEAEAARRGVSVTDLLADLAKDLPAPGATAHGRPGFVGLGASTSGHTAREADDLLADGFGR
jgi:hypothetical protein